MSKQQDAKSAQGYTPKHDPAICSTCKHFHSEFERTHYGYEKEINIRCGLGGFAVKKMGTCNKFERK